MKKVLFGLIVPVIVNFTVKAQENFKIGSNDNGKFVITENIDIIVKEWTNFLIENKINTTLATFEIKQEKYKDEEGGTYYYLIGTNREKTIKVAKLLLYNEASSEFYFNNKTCLDGHTVTCSGCTAGCNPEHVKKVGWICSDSCGSCTKSETVTVP